MVLRRQTAPLFPNDAPTRECLVLFGETTPAGNLPVYRIWMTQATFNTWAGRNKLNNTPLDVTFVLWRPTRHLQHVKALVCRAALNIAPGYSTPSGNRCGYSITFPSGRSVSLATMISCWIGLAATATRALLMQSRWGIGSRTRLDFLTAIDTRFGCTSMELPTWIAAVF